MKKRMVFLKIETFDFVNEDLEVDDLSGVSDDGSFVTESIILDADKQRLKTLNFAPGVKKSSREIYMPNNGIQILLDDIGDVDEKLRQDIEIEEYQWSANKSYRVEIKYSDNSTREIKGCLIRPDLPANWFDVITTIKDFLEYEDELIVLEKGCYATHTANDEVMIAKVYFSENEDSLYEYITDEQVEYGDIVIVPVGKNNVGTEAIVDSLEIKRLEELNQYTYKLKKVVDVIGSIFD